MRTGAGIALDQRYRLVRQIAVGGMGEVWEAYDETLARSVAVKVLREEFAGDAGFLERFRTEARNSASLSHANIAQLFDYGEQDGSAFLVMELVVGEPLSDLLEREPVLPARRLLPMLAQTARGLHAAHEAGVVHRDVKPGNILLGRGGRVKITDFGVSLARNQMTMTATGMVMGTAQYLAPEQAIGKPATPLSDLYSVGIIAYEALVGHRPFTGPTAVDIAVAHVNNPVPPLPGSVDKPLAELVMRLLSKDPSVRPTSGAELAELLDHLVPRTPPAGIPVLVSAPARTPDTFATSATTSSAGTSAGELRPGSTLAPPSYPPRRTRRGEDAARARSGQQRSGQPRTTSNRPVGAEARSGTATATSGRPAAQRPPGLRLGRRARLSWPLVGLVLLLVGLLGAALAERISRADGAGAGAMRVDAQVVASAVSALPSVDQVIRYPHGGSTTAAAADDRHPPATRTKDA